MLYKYPLWNNITGQFESKTHLMLMDYYSLPELVYKLEASSVLFCKFASISLNRIVCPNVRSYFDNRVYCSLIFLGTCQKSITLWIKMKYVWNIVAYKSLRTLSVTFMIAVFLIRYRTGCKIIDMYTTE